MKRKIAAAAALAVFLLCGCSGGISEEEKNGIIQGAAKRLQSCESLSVDMSFNQIYSFMGEHASIIMLGSSAVLKEPFKMKASYRIINTQSTVNMVLYAEETATEAVQYTSVDGGAYTKSATNDKSVITSLTHEDIAAFIYENAAEFGFKEMTTDEKSGRELTVFNGNMKGELVKSVYENSGIAKWMGSLENVDIDELNSQTVPVVLYIDRQTGGIKRVSMDFSKPFKQLFEETKKQYGSASPLEIKNMELSYEYSLLGETPAFEMDESVYSAAA